MKTKIFKSKFFVLLQKNFVILGIKNNNKKLQQQQQQNSCFINKIFFLLHLLLLNVFFVIGLVKRKKNQIKRKWIFFLFIKKFSDFCDFVSVVVFEIRFV